MFCFTIALICFFYIWVFDLQFLVSQVSPRRWDPKQKLAFETEFRSEDHNTIGTVEALDQESSLLVKSLEVSAMHLHHWYRGYRRLGYLDLLLVNFYYCILLPLYSPYTPCAVTHYSCYLDGVPTYKYIAGFALHELVVHILTNTCIQYIHSFDIPYLR